MEDLWKSKYIKYKNKYQKLKKLYGGDIDENDILSYIESIGYEFESSDIFPLTFLKNEGKDFIRLGKQNYFIQFDPIKFQDKSISPQLFSDTLREGIKGPLDSVLNIIDSNINGSTNIFLNNGTEIKDLSNIIKNRFGTYTFEISHVEYKFTFETINKSKNIIFETLKTCVDFLITHFTQFTKKIANFEIKNKDTSQLLLTQPIDSFENEITYKHITDPRFKDNENNVELFYLLKRDSTFDQSSWVPQMTVGVKLKNIHKVLLYISKSYPYLYKILNEAKIETKILLDDFKSKHPVEITDDILQDFGGFLFIVNYYCNLYFFKYQINKRSIDKNQYPILIRTYFKDVALFLEKKYKTIYTYLIDFLNKISTNQNLEIQELKKKYNYPIEYLFYTSDIKSWKIQLGNTFNLFKYLFFILTKQNNHYDSDIEDQGTKFEMKEDIILVEDRIFIKDITKIYDRIPKLTLPRLKAIVDSKQHGGNIQKGGKLYKKGNEIFSILDNSIYFSSFNLKTKEVQFWYCKKICEEIIKDVEKNPSRKYNILLLGVDLGGILINLTNKLNNVFIIGIDISDIYFNIIEKFSPPNTFKLIKTDAEQFMREQRKNTFDYIICDIFDGIKLPDFVLSNEFLSNINKNLSPGGKFLINTIGVYYLTIKDKFEKIFLNSEIRFETEYPYIYILNLLNLVTIVSKL